KSRKGFTTRGFCRMGSRYVENGISCFNFDGIYYFIESLIEFSDPKFLYFVLGILGRIFIYYHSLLVFLPLLTHLLLPFCQLLNLLFPRFALLLLLLF